MEGNILRCRSCKKLLLSGSLFCNYCGTEQQPQKKKKKTRRPMNSGTVRKLPGNRAKPYAAYLPRSMGGKYIGSYDTAAKASDALTLEIANRPSSDRIDCSVEDFYNFYISSPAFMKLTKSAQNTTYAAWKYCQGIKDMFMREAKTHAWQNCIDNAVEQGRSRSTCEKIRNLASQLCKEAMKDDVINKNYASLVSVSEGAGKKVKDIFTETEIALLKKHDDDPRVKFILILIYTGMRISELLEVHCKNVYARYIVGGKKTNAGKNRIIPILPDILPYIEFFKRDEGLLININGKAVSSKYARIKWFYEPLAELGILSADEVPPEGTPRLTPHCARHTFATFARQSGIEPDIITRIMGHSDYIITDEMYVDMQIDFILEEMKKMSSGN